MASITERLALLVTANTGGAVKGLNNVTVAAQQMAGAQAAAGKSSAVFSKGLTAGSAGVAFAAATAASAVVGFANSSVEAASALGEQQAATNIIFQEGAEVVKAYSQTTAGALGISQRAALQAANSFGDLFINTGFDASTAADLSTGLVQLAGDLASFKDLSTDDVLAKLQSGLVGETEPLRSLGIVINETAVKSKALELGLGGTNRELSEGEKILARYALFMERTANAQGDAERTGGSLANQQRQLNAQLEDNKAKLGQNLVPLYTAFTGALVDLTSAGEKNGVQQLGLGIRYEKNASVLNQLGQVLGVVKIGEDKTASSADVLTRAMERVKNTTIATAQAEVDRAKALSSASAAFESSVAADRAVVDARRGIVEADRSAAAAARGVRDARRGVRDAQERLNDTIASGVQVTQRITDAEKNLARAGTQVADAQERVVKAREALAKLAAGPSADEQGDAERNVRRSELGVASAGRRAEEAQKRLDDAREGKGDKGSRFSAADQADRIADSELELAEAALAVEEANDDLADSHDELTKLQERGREGSDELADATRELRDAERQVADAVDSHSSAQRSLNEAQVGVAEHERDIRNAREGLATATQGVADAQLNAARAGEAAARSREAYSTAIINAARAHEAENKLIDQGVTGLLLYRAELEALARQSPELFRALQPLLSRVNELLRGKTGGGGGFGGFLGGSIANAFANAPRDAYGNIYSAPTMAMFGEDGPEMILPLSPSKRPFARRLLQESGLAGEMFPQFGTGAIVSSSRFNMPSMKTGSASAGSMSGSAISVTVNAGLGANGPLIAEAVVSELKKWEMRNGPIPVRVSGSTTATTASRFG